MLHIQMQLCEISLWDWIVDRNKRCNEKTEETSSKIHHCLKNLHICYKANISFFPNWKSTCLNLCFISGTYNMDLLN